MEEEQRAILVHKRQPTALMLLMDFPGGSDGKASVYNAGDPGSIPGLRRSPGEGNSNPLQYSCMRSPMEREAWWATVHEVSKEMDATERLNNDNDAANVLL